MWLFNNSVLLCLITLQLSLAGWHKILNLTNKHIFQVLFKYGFRATVVQQTTDALVFHNYPVTIPLTTTLKDWIVRNNIHFFENETLEVSKIVRGKNIIFNRYYNLNPFILTKSTQKIYKAFITKFLLFLPLGWVQWNLSIIIRTQHTNLVREFHFLRFLNIYYFKVFNF